MEDREPEERGSGPEDPGKNGGFRVPPALMVPICAAVGWLMGDWAGGIRGGAIGVFLWRSRA